MVRELDAATVVDFVGRRLGMLLGACALAMISTLAIVLPQPARYEAASTILVARPAFRFNLQANTGARTDPGGGQTSVSTEARQEELKLSEETVRTVLIGSEVRRVVANEVGAELGRGLSLDELGEVEVAAREGGQLFVLRVVHPEAALAQVVANKWADVGARELGPVLASVSLDDSAIGASVLAADERLQRTEAALVEFDQKSSLPRLDAQLEAVRSSLYGLIIARGNYEQAEDHAERLKEQLAQGGQPALIDSATELLMVATFGTGGLAASSFSTQPTQTREVRSQPITVQVALDRGGESGLSQAQRIQALEAFQAALRAEVKATERSAAALDTEVRRMQQEKTQLASRRDKLQADREIALNVLKSLRLQQEQATLTPRAGQVQVRVVDRAMRQGQPVSRDLLRKLGLAALLGLSVGFVAALGLELVDRARPVRATQPARREA